MSATGRWTPSTQSGRRGLSSPEDRSAALREEWLIECSHPQIRRITDFGMEGIIYICGAIAFGVGYAFLKPALDGPWLIAITVAYFGLLRLAAYAAKGHALRKMLARASNNRRA